MTKQIGNYSIRQGTDGNDVNFSITPGVAYFAAGGDDTLWTKGSAQLPLGGLNWWVPSIASGGNGNDKYYVEFGSSTFIADASNSNADLLTVYDYLSKIENFFSIDKRHIFISTSFGTNILLIDALNVFGAIETIKFLDVTLSGASNSISSLLSNYQTELDQSFESLINGGYFNPMVMGVTGASEVRGIISMLTEFSVAEPTYMLAPSVTTINEGSTLTTSVATTNVASGATLHYSLSGAGITAADFSAGALIGSGAVGDDGKVSISHTLKNDLTTEGAESLEIKLFSDTARTVQVGSTAMVSVVDSSTTPVPTYMLTPSAASINEGVVLTSTVTTTNVATGTKLYYALSGTGITTADFSAGAITGEGITDATGKFTFTHTLANDLTTEGAESLEIKLYKDSARTLQAGSTATVSIADTSISYPLTLTAWTGNSQLPTTTVSENLGIINFRTSDLPAFSSNKYYWLLSGEGVTKDDFLNSGTFTSSIAFSGIVTRAGLITQPGPLVLSFQIRQDEQYENESITLRLFSDVQMVDLAAAPLTIRILDSPTHTLTPSTTSINEGAVLTSTVTTTNVAIGTKLFYALSGTGITAADFSAGALIGEGSTDATGKFTFTRTLLNDLTTEDTETLSIKLYSDSARTLQVGSTASVSIVDSSIKSKSFNLDVDGDGKVTALGDGLMIIRKLFGAAFAGDALTNKAMSPTATRTSAEIHEFIQQGITNGLLDIDKDGKTTALGDGLMVIRHLFGAAFAGEALTNKAISPASPYFGPPVDHLTIANAIDSMKVIPGLSA